MKKFLLFTAIVVLMGACGNKNDQNTDNTYMETTASQQDPEALRMDSIFKSEAMAFDTPNSLPTILLNDNNILFLTKNGTVGYNDPNLSSGKYVKQPDGGYLMLWGGGDAPNVLGVIYGDTYYQIYDQTESDDKSFDHLMDYFMSNFFTMDNPFEGMVSFDPASMTVTYQTEKGENKFQLSDLTENDKGQVKWENK